MLACLGTAAVADQTDPPVQQVFPDCPTPAVQKQGLEGVGLGEKIIAVTSPAWHSVQLWGKQWRGREQGLDPATVTEPGTLCSFSPQPLAAAVLGLPQVT